MRIIIFVVLAVLLAYSVSGSAISGCTDGTNNVTCKNGNFAGNDLYTTKNIILNNATIHADGANARLNLTSTQGFISIYKSQLLVNASPGTNGVDDCNTAFDGTSGTASFTYIYANKTLYVNGTTLYAYGGTGGNGGAAECAATGHFNVVAGIGAVGMPSTVLIKSLTKIVFKNSTLNLKGGNGGDGGNAMCASGGHCGDVTGGTGGNAGFSNISITAPQSIIINSSLLITKTVGGRGGHGAIYDFLGTCQGDVSGTTYGGDGGNDNIVHITFFGSENFTNSMIDVQTEDGLTEARGGSIDGYCATGAGVAGNGGNTNSNIIISVNNSNYIAMKKTKIKSNYGRGGHYGGVGNNCQGAEPGAHCAPGTSGVDTAVVYGKFSSRKISLVRSNISFYATAAQFVKYTVSEWISVYNRSTLGPIATASSTYFINLTNTSLARLAFGQYSNASHIASTINVVCTAGNVWYGMDKTIKRPDDKLSFTACPAWAARNYTFVPALKISNREPTGNAIINSTASRNNNVYCRINATDPDRDTVYAERYFWNLNGKVLDIKTNMLPKSYLTKGDSVNCSIRVRDSSELHSKMLYSKALIISNAAPSVPTELYLHNGVRWSCYNGTGWELLNNNYNMTGNGSVCEQSALLKYDTYLPIQKLSYTDKAYSYSRFSDSTTAKTNASYYISANKYLNLQPMTKKTGITIAKLSLRAYVMNQYRPTSSINSSINITLNKTKIFYAYFDKNTIFLKNATAGMKLTTVIGGDNYSMMERNISFPVNLSSYLGNCSEITSPARSCNVPLEIKYDRMKFTIDRINVTMTASTGATNYTKIGIVPANTTMYIWSKAKYNASGIGAIFDMLWKAVV